MSEGSSEDWRSSSVYVMICAVTATTQPQQPNKEKVNNIFDHLSEYGRTFMWR